MRKNEKINRARCAIRNRNRAKNPPNYILSQRLASSFEEAIGEDVKEEIGEDVKEEIGEDVKEEIGEDAKEEIGEDVKEEIKDTLSKQFDHIEITVDMWQNEWIDPHFLYSLIVNGTDMQTVYQFRFSKLKSIVNQLGIVRGFPPGHILPFLKRFDSEQNALARAKQLQLFLKSLTREQFGSIVLQLQ